MTERLRHHDLKQLRDCITDLYEVGGLPEFQRRVVRALPRIVAGDLAFYAEVDPRRRTVAWNPEMTTGLGLRDAERRFATHMGQLPLFRSYRRGAGSAVKISDFMSQRQFRRTAIYNEFYRPAGIEHQIAKGLPGPAGIVTVTGIVRRQRDFSERDRLVLNLLRPHLNQAYGNAATYSRMEKELALLRRGYETLERGLVIVGHDGRVRTASGRASLWLAEYLGPVKAGELPDALGRWLRSVDVSSLGEGAPLRLSRETRELTVRVVHDGTERLLLLSEHDSAQRPERLASLGLSPRQTEVLAWIAEGKTNADIATILGTSVRTIHKHVEHILAKLGVETRAAATVQALALLR